MASDPYHAHAAFVRPAAGHAEVWRILFMMMGFEAAFWLTPNLLVLLLPGTLSAAYIEGTSTFATLLQFASFGIVAALFIGLLRRVHGRGFWSLIGRADIALPDLWHTALQVGAVLLLISFLPTGGGGDGDTPQMRPFLTWFMLLPLSLAVLLIQVTTEELYFRGYLQQQLACRSRNPLLWMGLPSLVFGLSHFGNGIGAADSVLYVIWATALGMACADLTARTGTLGAAVGLHFANNIFAALIVGYEDWPSSGLALFMYPAFDPSQYDYSLDVLLNPAGLLEIMTSVGLVAVLWLAARVAVRC